MRVTFPPWWKVLYRWRRIRKKRCAHGIRKVYVCTECAVWYSHNQG